MWPRGRRLGHGLAADLAEEWETGGSLYGMAVATETSPSLNRVAASATTHCLTGCAIGEVLGFIGRVQLAAIEPRDMKRFAQHVAARGIAPNTVRLALAPVKALFATAVEEGLIRANPTAGLRISQTMHESACEDGERVKALTEAELRCLLGEIPSPWHLFFEFLAQTGFGSARRSHSAGRTSTLAAAGSGFDAASTEAASRHRRLATDAAKYHSRRAPRGRSPKRGKRKGARRRTSSSSRPSGARCSTPQT
jgi:hypothetical protein